MPYFGISCCYSLTVILLTVKVVFAIQDVESHKITNQSDIYIYIYTKLVYLNSEIQDISSKAQLI